MTGAATRTPAKARPRLAPVRFTLRLALVGGHSDGVRIGLTAACAALASVAVLCAAIVGAVSGGEPGSTPAPYSNPLLNEAGLRPGVVFTLAVLCVPVLFLVGQAARFGAPARDRRLAALRMAGASPGQTSLLVAVETGLATLLGSVLGLVAVLVGRVLLDDPDSTGIRPLPTDITVPDWAVFAVLVVLPGLGAGLSVLALRRVRLTPFGVVRRRRTRPPRAALAVLVLAGIAGLVVLAPLREAISGSTSFLVFGAVFLAVVLVIAVSLVLGAAAISAAIGTRVAARASRPDLLIAARRLAEDPFGASRALGALFVCIFVAVGVAGVREWLLGSVIANRQINGEPIPDDPETLAADPTYNFHQGAFDLVQLAMTVAIAIAAAAVLVALVEQIVERRRTLAALVAAGTPRPVLVRAGMLQIALPLIPGVVVAAMAGWLGVRGLFGWEVTARGGGYSTCTAPPGLDMAAAQAYCEDPAHLVAIPERTVTLGLGVPWDSLAVLGGGAVLGTLLLSGVSLLLLRSSTDLAELRAAA